MTEPGSNGCCATTGIIASDITFCDHQIQFDIDNGAEWNAGSFAQFDLLVENVPEPASVALLALGFVALGRSRRRA